MYRMYCMSEERRDLCDRHAEPCDYAIEQYQQTEYFTGVE
jgi:hypothetical protein